MFCRNLEDNVENSAEDGGLACEISEGRLKSLIVGILIVKILWFWSAGAEESAVINKIPELLARNLCVAGIVGAAGAENLAVIKRENNIIVVKSGKSFLRSQRSCVAESATVVLPVASQTWKCT